VASGFSRTCAGRSRTSDDDDVTQIGGAGQRGLQLLENVGRRHEHLRPRFAQEVCVVSRTEPAVARDGDGADLHRAEIGGRQLRGVRQDEQHALLALDAEGLEAVAHPVRERGDLAVGERAPLEPDGLAGAAPRG
jgi:hypothetical protein